MTIDVLYVRPGGSGWGPVDVLARLAARLLDGRLVEVEDRGGRTLLDEPGLAE